MLEIVHDLAPGANLFFATAASGQAQFAANIEALCNAGAGGCFHFSSAGNSGNRNDGTSGVWEGDFVAVEPIGPRLRRHGA